MPEPLHSAMETLKIMERFGYKLQELYDEDAELMGLLEMEYLATHELGGEHASE